MKSKSKHKVVTASVDVLKERLEGLKALYPDVFSEGKVDFEKLKVALGEEIEESQERYSFTWAGKRNAIRILQTSSHATLIPARDESLDFDKTQNIFIEGDNLEALKLLYKPYFGQVKMIYIDPPYNTGKDFIYPDNFTDPLDNYLKLTGQKDTAGNLLTSNPESSGRYHSAWLSMMYPRLFLARQLLSDDGLIFISIDDRESYNLRQIMNEIFGEENFIAEITWEKRYTRNNDAKLMASVIDYILLYRKGEALSRIREARSEKSDSIYTNPDNDPRGPWTSVSYVSQRTKSQRPNLSYKIKNPYTDQLVEHPTNAWKYSQQQNSLHAQENKLYWGLDGGYQYPRLKRFHSELNDGMVLVNLWDYKSTGTVDDGTKEVDNLLGKGIFDYPKPISLIKRMLKIIPDKDAIILDFFAGSGTTAHAVLSLNHEDGGNRRFICVQLPEPCNEKSQAYKSGYSNISEICKERIRKAAAILKKDREGRFAFNKNEDLGFRVFKLNNSNFRQWQSESVEDTERYTQQMEMSTDPLVDGWVEEKVVYEVAVKEGLGLNISIEKSAVEKISLVKDPDQDQYFYISLAKSINIDELRPLNLKAEDLFICRDAALDDETAANLALQCRLKTI